MNIDMSIFHQTFFEEAADLLEDLEGRLLQLSDTPDDPDLLNTIFRCAHSIKGGSATFGFTEIAHFTHGLETLLDLLRNGQLQVTQILVALLLESQDQLKALLAVARGRATSAPDSGPLVERIEAAIAAQSTACQSDGRSLSNLSEHDSVPALIATEIDTASNDASATAHDSPGTRPTGEVQEEVLLRRYRLRLIPDEGVLRQGTDLGRLFGQLGAICHVVSTTCDLARLPALADLLPESSYLAWELVLDSACAPERLLEVFEFIADESEITLAEETPAPLTILDADVSSFASLTDSGSIASDVVRPLQVMEANTAPVERRFDPIDTIGLEHPLSSGLPLPVSQATGVQQGSQKENRRDSKGQTGARATENTTLRVATDKVDKLINLVGELVINQSMLNEVVQEFSMAKLPRLMEAVSEMERACRELQERVMAVRMLPIKNAFGRFPRLVHDLSVACGKRIELKTTGEETELDKTLIEAIADPLTHLVRNSVDHGLEPPDERRAAGKAELGTVTLNAFHEGGCIVIEVSDDGRGLNRERILHKAYERGLLHESDPPPTDEAIYNLIFHPGLSTAAQVTDLSGRGVGMDIVKQTVQGLGGTISLNTVPGKGTRFRIRLPLTMAILEGLSLGVGREVYILPLTSIVESIRPKAGDVRRIAGSLEVVLVRGEVLNILRLYEVFGAVPSVTEPTQGLLVIVENDGKKVALLVDELIGQSQVVIKSLEANYRKVDGIAGATILGDGRVALIVDIPGLIQGARAA